MFKSPSGLVFTIIISTALLLCAQANAQIIYTDIVDTTFIKRENQTGTLSYILDVNNDNINDYNISVRTENIPATGCTVVPPYQTNLSSWIGTMPLYSNSIGDSAGSVAIIQFDSLISSTSHNWNSGQINNLFFKEYTYPSCNWDSSLTGYWYHDVTGYIGLKFKVGSDILYGWLRVRIQDGIDSTDNWYISMTIMDYAFNSAAGQPIHAGETGVTGLYEPGSYAGVNLFFENVNDEIIIQRKSYEKWKLTIYNQSGYIVSVSDLNGKYSRLEFSNKADGIYIFRITENENLISSGKFIKN